MFFPPRCRRSPAASLLLLLVSASVLGAEFTDPDDAVAELARHCAARLDSMREVAAYKWLHGLPVADPQREIDLLGRLEASGAAAGLDPVAIGRFFAANIALARREQVRLMNQFETSGLRFEGTPRDLHQTLRPEIDRVNAALLRAIVLAGPALEAPDFSVKRRVLFEQAFAEHDLDVDPAELDDLLRTASRIRRQRAPDLDSIRALGLLRVGLTGDYAPFSYLRDGSLAGGDVEAARLLADHLGVELHFVRTSWPALVPDLLAGRFDLAMGGITRTAERAKLGAFSLPYYRGGKTIVARCGETAAYDTLAELLAPGVRLIVNPGGTNERFVRERLAGQEPIVFRDNTRIPMELLGGRADVMVTDDIEVELWQRRHTGLCRATPQRFTEDEKAFLMPQDPELVAAVDAWLEPALADGTVERQLSAAIELAAAQ